MTTTTTVLRPTNHPCDDGCGYAASSPATCRCACRGEYHGAHRPTPQGEADARARVTTRGAFAGIPQTDDEEDW